LSEPLSRLTDINIKQLCENKHVGKDVWGEFSYVDQHLRKLLMKFFLGETHKITLAWVQIVGPRVT